MIIIFGLLIGISLKNGIDLHKTNTDLLPKNTSYSPLATFTNILKANVHSNIMVLLIQIIVILFTCRLFSVLFTRIGQPGVIGEIAAGIILGPSFLGHFFPQVFNFIFTQQSLENVHLISQIGLILFMFVIGLEVNFGVLKNKINETLVISHAGILVPFFLGIIASYYIYERYASNIVSFLPFALFIGISMSITAFPVLARIVQERGLTYSPLGILSIASAANDDVTAWCLLAVVIAVAKAGVFLSSLYTIAFTILYILFMFLIVRPFFNKIGKIYANSETVNKNFVSFIFLTLIVSALCTEFLGIHALFGAFIAGVIMPSNLNFRHTMINKIEDITLAFFLPLFFAYTGLNTNILLINNASMWITCGLLIILAVVGKFGGCSLAAKLVGESWHDSLIIGMLMNTRGLMELIALNIGYEMGILPQPIFALLVIMALVTTFMTTPALHLISFLFEKNKVKKPLKQKVMLSFGLPRAGVTLLSMCRLIFGENVYKKNIVAAHFIQGTELNMISAEHYAQESFEPVMAEANKHHIPLNKYYRVTEDIVDEIIATTKKENVDYLFLGSTYKQIQEEAKNTIRKKGGFLVSLLKNIQKNSYAFSGIVLPEKVQKILQRVNCNVLIFISKRDIIKTSDIAIVIHDQIDRKLLEFAYGMLESVPSIQIYQAINFVENNNYAKQISELVLKYPGKIELHQYESLKLLAANSLQDLLFISSYDVCLKMMRHNKSSNILPSYLSVCFKKDVKK